MGLFWFDLSNSILLTSSVRLSWRFRSWMQRFAPIQPVLVFLRLIIIKVLDGVQVRV